MSATSCHRPLSTCTYSGQTDCITNVEYVSAPRKLGESIAVEDDTEAFIPAGYYDGTATATFTDANLTAANIREGSTVFGIIGTSRVTPHDDCADQTLNGTPCSTAANRYVTATVGSSITASSGSLSATIPQGYYDGTQTATTSDPALSASSICNTTNIFGMSGSAVCQNTSAGTPSLPSQVLTGSYSWNSSGTSFQGTMSNRGALDAASSFPGAGYYNGTVTNLPLASGVCSGTSVLGVSGNAACSISPLGTNALRDRATTLISQKAEVTTYAGINLPVGYRTIPDILSDNEGAQFGIVVYAPRPTVNCGTTQPTIAGRVAHCNVSWNGATQGHSGFATWVLVTRVSGAMEVWRDERTGLLWSSRLEASNWCKASGNAQANDPSNFCNNVTNQPGFGATPWSYCEELGTVPAFAADAELNVAGNAWSTTYSPQKGHLGAQSTPSVRWRLPTRMDYQQADLDGIRYVLPGIGITRDVAIPREWTATIVPDTRANAWTFSAFFGGHARDLDRTTNQHIRCVGR